MKIGFIGLGRMGKAMVLRLLEKGIDVVVYNRTREKTLQLAAEVRSSGELYCTYSIDDLLKQLESPRMIWLMVEAGRAVDEMIEKLLASGLTHGDILIDGGNSFYKDSIRRSQKLIERDIHFVDIGTSGGLEGARNGACLMVGGEQEVYKKISPLLEAIAIDGGVGYFGPHGAGHFVKMIHNGVEYAMLQAIGEGFEILKTSPYRLDLPAIADNWNHGSVVRGWLMELTARALDKDPTLEKIEGSVGGGETGEWTVKTARDQGVVTPVIEESINARKKSQARPNFAGKVIQALRWEFGRHES